MRMVALAVLACLPLVACSTPNQTFGTAGGAVTGGLIGGPVGAVVGGAGGAILTRPGAVLGGSRYRCHYRDRYGHVHYHACR